MMTIRCGKFLARPASLSLLDERGSGATRAMRQPGVESTAADVDSHGDAEQPRPRGSRERSGFVDGAAVIVGVTLDRATLIPGAAPSTWPPPTTAIRDLGSTRVLMKLHRLSFKTMCILALSSAKRRPRIGAAVVVGTPLKDFGIERRTLSRRSERCTRAAVGIDVGAAVPTPPSLPGCPAV